LLPTRVYFDILFSALRFLLSVLSEARFMKPPADVLL
jgi:hypothetical protein